MALLLSLLLSLGACAAAAATPAASRAPALAPGVDGETSRATATREAPATDVDREAAGAAAPTVDADGATARTQLTHEAAPGAAAPAIDADEEAPGTAAPAVPAPGSVPAAEPVAAVAALPLRPTSAATAGALPADAPLRAPASAPGAAEGGNWTVPVLHGVGVMLGMRVGLSALWPRAYDPSRLREGARQLGVAFSRPPEFHRGVPLLESDGDPWLLNTVGHGLFGAEMYGRARHCGHSPLASLAAAAVASTAWEYSLEALHQRPSALDLVWTPLAGAVLGEGRFQLYRLVRGSPSAGVGPLRRVLLFALDPLGEAERGLLGTSC